MTLWRGDHYEGGSFFLSESKHQRREEWKALPAAQYAALVAERDALRDALTDLIDAASHVPVDREWSPLLTSSLTCARAALGAERA